MYDTLVHLELMPYRELSTPDALKRSCKVLIKGSLTRRNAIIVARKMMSNRVSITVGKKSHMLKNTVMSLTENFMVLLGRNFSVHNYDYIILKQELIPQLIVVHHQ